MSNIAIVIRDILAKKVNDLYASDKYDAIKDKSSAEVLEWACINLDPGNQRTLLTRIGIDANHASVLRRAFEAARWAKAGAA